MIEHGITEALNEIGRTPECSLIYDEGYFDILKSTKEFHWDQKNFFYKLIFLVGSRGIDPDRIRTENSKQMVTLSQTLSRC